nr:MAG TPA: hypothetical protein [Caudoviricetes sp.]
MTRLQFQHCTPFSINKVWKLIKIKNQKERGNKNE